MCSAAERIADMTKEAEGDESVERGMFFSLQALQQAMFEADECVPNRTVPDVRIPFRPLRRARVSSSANRTLDLTVEASDPHHGRMTPASRWSSLSLAALGVLGMACLVQSATLPDEQPLWKDLSDNPIVYADGEKMRTRAPEPWVPTGRCRAFYQVSQPTYAVHRPKERPTDGVGLVLCPGGGYRDVWIDWEGHDIALWLAEYGVTSLVLKYRTNERIPGATTYFERVYDWETYLPEVVSDAKEAIRILRDKSGELGLDPEKIGVAGFSAGGNLALRAAFDERYWRGDYRTKGHPDFVGLFYPSLRRDHVRIATDATRILPVFIFNGGEDRVTPPSGCLELYRILLEKKMPTEMYLYSKGGHGFAMGEGAGRAAARWKRSFVAWLQDQGFLDMESLQVPSTP